MTWSLRPNAEEVRQHMRALVYANDRAVDALFRLLHAKDAAAEHREAHYALQRAAEVARIAGEALGIPIDGDAPLIIETDGEEIS
jgi:hypothetical protein